MSVKAVTEKTKNEERESFISVTVPIMHDATDRHELNTKW